VIRTFRPGDEHVLREIHLASITKVGPQAYNAQQVAAWANKTREPWEWLEWHDYGDRITIAFTADGNAAAFTLLEADGHLDMLYCHPRYVRQGHALSLVKEASVFGRAAGLSMITTDASELAKPVFLAAGYTVERRQEFLLDGIPIHNYAMSKELLPQAQPA